MANSDNECKDLNVIMVQSDHFDRVFNMQKDLQLRLGNNFEGKSIKEISNYFLFNKHAIEDEMSEMMDALGGIKDGIGNGAWKTWKNNHDKASSMTIKSLSKGDLKELKMEIVDMFHFFMNFAIAINMTGSELFSYYIAKNKENHERQNNNY